MSFGDVPLLSSLLSLLVRTFMSMCGDAQEDFSFIPGRSSPELASALYQLEAFCLRCDELKSGKMDKDSVPCFEDLGLEDLGLLSSEQPPELLPYRSLDASRLRLVGEGRWPMESYLDGVLWMPFQEPFFLLHGLPVSDELVPNFTRESPHECFKLAKVWDARGLLELFPKPVMPGHCSRVFNAFKDATKDRQIGDRQLPNLSEYHIDGPSKA